MSPCAKLLSGGKRLHLQHGPIDLVIGAGNAHREVFSAAMNRFETVLSELVAELPELRRPLTPDTPPPQGAIAKKMDRAVRPYCAHRFVTRMASVAGAVADTILKAMKEAAPLSKAYVNNGGDIAIELADAEHFTTAMVAHNGADLGRISLYADDAIGGIATSGMSGRSFSFGIADSVTVLAASAAKADIAATLIANNVDLPDHPAIKRAPASSLDPDSDLGERLVARQCPQFSCKERRTALEAGERMAARFQEAGLIAAAALFLQGDSRIVQGDSRIVQGDSRIVDGGNMFCLRGS